MSMSAQSSVSERFSRLDQLAVDKILPNPNNPRLVFPDDELDRLMESIAQEGILVPIVVFQDGDRFTLIDGERRYKCAVRLGLDQIPCLVTDQRDDISDLVSMFNIHHMRERWQDMPTARALATLERSEREVTGVVLSLRSLSAKTGLSTEKIKRFRFAMTLPTEYQAYIHDGGVPLNWFWELDRNVIKPLAKHRRVIFDDYGEPFIWDAFVKKRLAGTATDSVAMRKIRSIINFAGMDATESPSNESVLDETIRELISNDELTITTAYEDTIQIMVEADKLQRNTDNMILGFNRLLARTRNEEERDLVLSIALDLRQGLDSIIAEHRS